MTITESQAFEAMLAHHRNLEDEVARRVNNVRACSESAGAHEPAVAELVAYMADEVLPHALAEEQSIYRAAGRRSDLAATVASMTEEHRTLASSIEKLARSTTGADATTTADALGALFSAHVGKENELLLPKLLADETADLSELLAEMHHLTEESRQPLSAEEASGALDPPSDGEAALVSLLIEAAGALAEVGQGDKACRVVASAWATVHVTRADLAVRVTAALHRLVRTVTSEPVHFSGAAATEAQPPRWAQAGVLDVRSLAPAQRHEAIFAAYDALGAGAMFELVNDHDPKPLRYQFEAEQTGRFTWDYLEEGPTVWRVRIGRTALAPSGGNGEPELDVRAIPHGQRHGSIFAAYDALETGAGFVLMNDHDPKPLHYQFEAEHAGRYTWDYLEAGPEVWRVRIGRPAASSA